MIIMWTTKVFLAFVYYGSIVIILVRPLSNAMQMDLIPYMGNKGLDQFSLIKALIASLVLHYHHENMPI